MAEELSKREKKMLADLAEWNGKWSIYWGIKTRESLVKRGLAEVIGHYVHLTEKGKEQQ